MTTWLLMLDAFLLQWLNRWVAQSPATFTAALRLSERAAWVLAGLLLVWLWFSGDEGLVPYRSPYTQWQARRRVLTVLAALGVGFLLSRLIQTVYPRPRPLVVMPLQVPVLPQVWDAVRQAMQGQGAFPSDHAVMFATVVLGVMSLARWQGLVAGLVAVYFAALRVGLGFHWPSDVLGGAALAAAVLAAALFLERRWPRPWDWVVAGFYRHPKIAYPLAFLGLYDFTHKFQHLLGVVAWFLAR